MNIKRTTLFICRVALGIALYACLSLSLHIPLFVGHLALDVGYMVLAMYAMMMGPIPAAIVGGAGCVIVSLISSGWFPAGWLFGNIFIGLVCGWFYTTFDEWESRPGNLVMTILVVFMGIGLIKTGVECVLFNIPFLVKFVKNMTAFICDAAVMALGYWFLFPYRHNEIITRGDD